MITNELEQLIRQGCKEYAGGRWLDARLVIKSLLYLAKQIDRIENIITHKSCIAEDESHE